LALTPRRRSGRELSGIGAKTVLIHHGGGRFLYDTGLLKRIREDLEDKGTRILP
jgi:hypothetical protein